MSFLTTNLGPRVSINTVNTNDPGYGAFEVSVPLIFNGANLQTGNAGAATLGTGVASLISHSGNSIYLAWDSGTTVYYWLNTDAV